MPIEIISSAVFEGPEIIPGWDYIVKFGPLVLLIAALKYYFGGTSNTWERDMHGKVFMITGGTSGLGAYLAWYFALKGAQIILLVRSTEDSWVVDYVEDLREKTNNFLIYAEECDLNSLYSVRKFATRWLDNKPPRRLDGVICCASDSIPRGKDRQVTEDGVERQIGVNYLSHYHLLTLLQPSLLVQPPDRDVRVVLATCASQALGDIDESDLLWQSKRYPKYRPWKLYGTSKLLLGLFAQEFQRKLNEYKRPDKAPCGVRVNIVNPGIMRTPSTRRFLSMGTLWGLILYIITWPLWFLFFKSPSQGAQSMIYATANPIFANMDGGNLIQECKIMKKRRDEFQDEDIQSKVYAETAKHIEVLEKRSAIERKKKEKQNKKNVNLNEKPTSEEDLDAKLGKLRSTIGVPQNTEELFPTNL